MIFVLSKLFWYIAAPSNLMIVCILAGVGLMILTKRRRGLGLVLLGSVSMAAVTLLPVANWLMAPLENRFPQPAPLQHVDGIIVLGGSVNPYLTKARHQISVDDAPERMFEAAAIARHYPSARIIVSGGDPAIFPADIPSEASVMRDLLVALGIEPERIQLEDTSRNTYENAVNSHNLAQPKPGETWLLITSGWHMPRAVGCFREAGWTVVPYPVDYHTTGNRTTPSTFIAAIELVHLNIAVKEWIGLVVYRVLGRTDSLYPAPTLPVSKPVGG